MPGMKFGCGMVKKYVHSVSRLSHRFGLGLKSLFSRNRRCAKSATGDGQSHTTRTGTGATKKGVSMTKGGACVSTPSPCPKVRARTLRGPTKQQRDSPPTRVAVLYTRKKIFIFLLFLRACTSLTRLLGLPESLVGAHGELLKRAAIGQTVHQKLVEDVPKDATEQAAHRSFVSNSFRSCVSQSSPLLSATSVHLSNCDATPTFNFLTFPARCGAHRTRPRPPESGFLPVTYVRAWKKGGRRPGHTAMGFGGCCACVSVRAREC